MTGGKKLFLDLVNKSNAKNMYPKLESKREIQALFRNRMLEEFCKKNPNDYVPPPVNKSFARKDTFVHNCIQNKQKSNVDHIANINKEYSKEKHTILKLLHEHDIDFRMLTQFKNALFDSEELEDNHLLSLDNWKSILKYEMHNILNPVEQLILKEIQTTDGKVNLMKFTDLVDLFFYSPLHKPYHKNDSHETYYILSSNTEGGFSSAPKGGGSL